MKYKDLISIIMPAYNSGRTISRAIESVIKQTYTNFELIIINDGSTDNSLEICKRYCDPRIHVYNQNNSGASEARNYGLKLANGKFLTFIDSDDWYDPKFLEYLYEGISNTGMSVCGFTYHLTDSISQVNCEEAVYNNIKNNYTFIKTFETGIMNPSWNKLYRLSIIKSHGISFSKDKIGEDFIFNLSYLKHIQCLRYLPECLYHYDITSSTLTRQFSEDMFITYFKTHKLLRSHVDISLYRIVDGIMYPQYAALTIRFINSLRSEKKEKDKIYTILNKNLSNPLIGDATTNYKPCSMYDRFIMYCIRYRWYSLMYFILWVIENIR